AAALVAAWLVRPAGIWGRLALVSAGLAVPLIPALTCNWYLTGSPIARAEGLIRAPGLALEHFTRRIASFPTDFLVGQLDVTPDLSEAFRWAPLAGIVVLAAAAALSPPRSTLVGAIGLALVGCTTVAL